MSNEHIKSPSCVLMDFDNTLYEYDGPHEAGMDAVVSFVSERLKLDTARVEHHMHAARSELKQRLGNVASSHSRLLYFSRAIEMLGFKTQSRLALQSEQVYWSEFLNRAALREGVLEFLDELRLLEIPVIIVTDLTTAVQYRKLIYFGLDGIIDFVVTSEEAGSDKPDAKIYELALSKLGGIEGTVWMIGDNLVCDIRGSKAAIGATTIHFSAQKESQDSHVDFTVKNFNELTRMLRLNAD